MAAEPMMKETKEVVTFSQKNKELLNVDFFSEYIPVLRNYYQVGNGPQRQEQIEGVSNQQRKECVENLAKDPAISISETKEENNDEAKKAENQPNT